MIRPRNIYVADFYLLQNSHAISFYIAADRVYIVYGIYSKPYWQYKLRFSTLSLLCV